MAHGSWLVLCGVAAGAAVVGDRGTGCDDRVHRDESVIQQRAQPQIGDPIVVGRDTIRGGSESDEMNGGGDCRDDRLDPYAGGIRSSDSVR